MNVRMYYIVPENVAIISIMLKKEFAYFKSNYY